MLVTGSCNLPFTHHRVSRLRIRPVTRCEVRGNGVNVGPREQLVYAGCATRTFPHTGIVNNLPDRPGKAQCAQGTGCRVPGAGLGDGAMQAAPRKVDDGRWHVLHEETSARESV